MSLDAESRAVGGGGWLCEVLYTTAGLKLQRYLAGNPVDGFIKW